MADNEKITIEFNLDKWEAIRHYLELTNEVDFVVKSVKVKDDFFKGDDMHKALKLNADKAYKELQQYEFKKRHNIK